MNLTVLENRLADFNNTMKGIADNLQYFRELVEKKIAEEEKRQEERKYEREAEKKHDLSRCFIAHKGDGFTVCDDFTIPEKDVDPDNRPTPNVVKEGERLTIKSVDCLSIKYDVSVTLLRNDHGTEIVLTLDQIRKLIENDILVIVGKANA